MSINKVLPSDFDMEQGILGSILIYPETIVGVSSILKPEHFYKDAHQIIYKAILTLYDKNEPINFLIIGDELERDGKLEGVGGTSYIMRLTNDAPPSAIAISYAQIVEKKARFRSVISACGYLAGMAYKEDEAVFADAQEKFFQIGQGNVGNKVNDHITSLNNYWEQLQELHEQNQKGVLTGIPTGFKLLNTLLGGFRHSKLYILAARPGDGKCLPYWTLIDEPLTGERITIEDCVKRQQSTVYGMSEEGKVRVAAISDWIDSGIQPCYRVLTKLGRMVETTGHHPFFTVQGWKPLNELSAGNHIAVPTRVPVFGSDESWHLDLVRLLAYFIAEGGLTDRSPKFTNTDPVIIDDFKQIIQSHFPACATRQEKITYIVAQPRRHGGRMPKNPVTAWLTKLGMMGKLAKDKYFPSCIWKWSKRYLAEFIRVLMSCDGSIYERYGVPEIEFTVASQKLASDLHHAFTRFGIISKFHKTSKNAWRVMITERESIKRYQEEIGWIGEKSTRFNEYTHKIPKRGGNNGHAPKETWDIIRAEINAKGLSISKLAYMSGETTKQGKYAGYKAHTNQSISRHRLGAFAKVLDHHDLMRIASPDIYWDEITSIEYIGEHQVYDLTVPDGSNFIAQDVFVHNTALALNFAYEAIRKGSQVLFFSIEMDEGEMMQRLVAIESKVDAMHLRDARFEGDEWERIVDGIERLQNYPGKLWTDDTPANDIDSMRAKARDEHAKHGIDMIIVDYLQLAQAGKTSDNKMESRRIEVEKVSRQLKEMSRELKVPVIALAQLNRDVESRANRVPQLSDLREAGGIEQDCDVAMFIYRDPVIPKEAPSFDVSLLIEKHRNGPKGSVPLHFVGAQTRFYPQEIKHIEE